MDLRRLIASQLAALAVAPVTGCFGGASESAASPEDSASSVDAASPGEDAAAGEDLTALDAAVGEDLPSGPDDVDAVTATCAQRPLASGCACDDDAACATSLCVAGPDGRTCAAACASDADCAAGRCLPTAAGPVCVEPEALLCLPCSEDADCQRAGGAATCEPAGDGGDEGSFCVAACGAGEACPDGYACVDAQCRPTAGSCGCDALGVALGASTACTVTDAGGTCEGRRACGRDGLSACATASPSGCAAASATVSGARLHLPGAALSRPAPGATWFVGSLGHGCPTGRSGNGTRRIHYGFHSGLRR